ncbi:hypothetical protein [Nitrosopumilus maritimus]|uniref:Uncharacterized protein n=1 Tax=Nitrosopumilus maritimus (strain SCM1) TaxID=436308 RepID=A9A2N2_NITMS|nr:hypothetical protein [Nitrosopumilus maritimus]ABX13271.1 hypothetical protein Nmar_1375 [Nitrosopumilus maritimus SCM1]
MNVTDESNNHSINSLSPTLKEFAKKIQSKNRMGQDVCVRDFPELKEGAFRQRIKRLKDKGLIITVIKGTFCHYKIKGENTGRTKRTVTNEGMVVGTNMQEIINEASKQVPTIHDIKMNFPSVQIYKNAIKKGMVPNKHNKGIFLDSLTLSKDIYAKIVIYPKTISIDIGCTWEPIIYDIRGAQEFLGHVEFIRAYLYVEFKTKDMPHSLDWIVNHYHLNQDGQTEFTGEPFKRTISDMVGGFIRIYAKKFPDKSTRVRLERIITPKTSVKNQIEDMQNVGKYLHSEKRDISNIMPSEILSLNQFAKTVEKISSMHNPLQGGFFSL